MYGNEALLCDIEKICSNSRIPGGSIRVILCIKCWISQPLVLISGRNLSQSYNDFWKFIQLFNTFNCVFLPYLLIIFITPGSFFIFILFHSFWILQMPLIIHYSYIIQFHYFILIFLYSQTDLTVEQNGNSCSKPSHWLPTPDNDNEEEIIT